MLDMGNAIPSTFMDSTSCSNRSDENGEWWVQ
jgi:hypothetical protein